MTLGDAWEQHADEWISWARASPHDGFAKGTWPELRAVLPAPSGLAIEIGCGEGRVGRALSRRGHQVIGVEQSPSLARAVREAARALRRTGKLCVAIVHPFSSAEDRATWDSDVAMYSESYLRERRIEDHIERDDWSMTFISQHRPLSTYLTGFSDARFARSGIVVGHGAQS